MTESVLRGVLPSETNLRDLVTAWLPQGFAKIVQPIASTTITTDTQGLVAGEVKIQTMTGPVPAYRAMPEKGGKLPVVLVVQEIFGVHEHIKDVCRRLAKLGYFAIAVDLYHRQGDVTKFTDNQEIFAKVVNFVPDSQVMSDLDASVVYAESTGKADTSRLGVTGFCWGGSTVNFLAVTLGTELHAGVPFYGAAAETASVPKIKAPLLIHYAETDPRVNEMRPAFEAALKAAGVPHQMHIYPGTQHGFHNNSTPRYHEASAKLAWERTIAFFRKNLA